MAVRPLSSCLLLLSLAAATGARGEFPELLKEAMTNAGRESGRWAYTETTTVRAERGKSARRRPPRVTIVRFDPSKPYAGQYTPVQVNGKAPTARDLKRYRERGEGRGRKLETPPPPAAENREDSLGKHLDLDHITATEDGGAVIYVLPVRPGEKVRGVPMDRFELSVRVNKEQRALEGFAMRLRDSLRMKLVVNLQSGGFTASFAPVDPKHPPLMTAMHGDMAFSFLFIKGRAIIEQTRTDYQRVTPYRDHFHVDVGALKVLDF